MINVTSNVYKNGKVLLLLLNLANAETITNVWSTFE